MIGAGNTETMTRNGNIEATRNIEWHTQTLTFGLCEDCRDEKMMWLRMVRARDLATRVR